MKINRTKNASRNILFGGILKAFTLIVPFLMRSIIIHYLGVEYLGLNGLFISVLQVLNLAELGISGSVAFFLYKPLQQDDRVKICEILSVFGYLYKWIGNIILVAGLVVSVFFPWIFGKTLLGLGIVYFSFYSILGSALIGYFINYRQILLTADQKEYIVAIYFQSAGIIKTVVQITLAYYYKNLY